MQQADISGMRLRDRNTVEKKKKCLSSAFALLPQLFHYKFGLPAEFGDSRGSGRQSEGGEFCK